MSFGAQCPKSPLGPMKSQSKFTIILSSTPNADRYAVHHSIVVRVVPRRPPLNHFVTLTENDSSIRTCLSPTPIRLALYPTRSYLSIPRGRTFIAVWAGASSFTVHPSGGAYSRALNPNPLVGTLHLATFNCMAC
jgi:hypothetical protein